MAVSAQKQGKTPAPAGLRMLSLMPSPSSNTRPGPRGTIKLLPIDELNKGKFGMISGLYLKDKHKDFPSHGL
ncbi:hypothetical protein Tco_1336660 [Tanacetum coccineum]